MRHSGYDIPGGRLLRFDTERGVVWVRVIFEMPHIATVQVYEEAAGMVGGDEAEAAARNRFGTGLMLRIMRTVKAEFPGVEAWAWDRVSGAYAFGGEKVRV